MAKAKTQTQGAQPSKPIEKQKLVEAAPARPAAGGDDLPPVPDDFRPQLVEAFARQKATIGPVEEATKVFERARTALENAQMDLQGAAGELNGLAIRATRAAGLSPLEATVRSTEDGKGVEFIRKSKG